MDAVATIAPTRGGDSLVRRDEVPASRQPAIVYLAGLAPGSRRTMAQVLDTIADLLTGGRADAATLDWARLRPEHTQIIRAALAERYAPTSVNKMMWALRGVLREAWRLGWMDTDTYHRAADLPALGGTTLPRRRALSAGEVRTLLAACAADPTPAGTRDAALLAMLYGAGLRPIEAVALDVSDYDAGRNALTIRAGTGHKPITSAILAKVGGDAGFGDRIWYAEDGSRAALEAWLRVRGTGQGPLFVPVKKGGRVLPRRMSAQVVRYVLRKRATEAGVMRCSPRDLRRLFFVTAQQSRQTRARRGRAGAKHIGVHIARAPRPWATHFL